MPFYQVSIRRFAGWLVSKTRRLFTTATGGVDSQGDYELKLDYDSLITPPSLIAPPMNDELPRDHFSNTVQPSTPRSSASRLHTQILPAGQSHRASSSLSNCNCFSRRCSLKTISISLP